MLYHQDLYSYFKNESVISLASSYNDSRDAYYSDGLRTERPEFDSRQGQDLYLLHSPQTGSGAHPASYQMDTGGSFPHMSSLHNVQLIKHRDGFILPLLLTTNSTVSA
jgi:hypothetical protein